VVARRPKQLPVSGLAAELPDDLQKLASRKHAINVVITEMDWLLATHEARSQEEESVSDVVRRALRALLDSSPHRDFNHEDAVRDLEHQAEFERVREQRANMQMIATSRRSQPGR
jgi:Arc/MetJ-type ribon-helix-helix transcriptional regulator